VPASAPRRRPWGWHQLADSWASRIVSAAHIRSGELVLDLGAGEGALTAHLVAAGARVIAVELHPVRRERLRKRFAGQSVTVVNADAAQLRLPTRPFRVLASPPYAVSSAILRILLSRGSRLQSADLVLQRATVERFVQGRAPGAARWTRDFVTRRGLTLPRSAFWPPPSVDSAVLVIRRR
jgi:23S rRNA (adenine-N6)-dimethyltransferase